jgi:FkbM family methyltransferase
MIELVTRRIMGNINQQFIDGSWYENEYSQKWYRDNYIESPEPDWAKQANEYYVGLKILYTGLKPNHKILDLGSSVGRYMGAWKRLGYRKIKGIDISRTACENHQSGCEIYHGSVADMSMFENKQFDLVQSAAFFEHIDESIVGDCIRECFRVGRMQAHTIGLHEGTDPSHINVKTMDEWVEYFNHYADNDHYLLGYLPDPLLHRAPILIAVHEDDLTYPLALSFKQSLETPDDMFGKTGILTIKHPHIKKRDVTVRIDSSDWVILDDSIKYMNSFAGDHKTMVEIGAHVGASALYFAVEMGFEKIIAVEADFRNYKLLVDNIKANGLEDTIKPVLGAVGIRSGEIRELYMHGINKGQKGLYLAKGKSCGHVVTISLEEVLSRLDTVDVLKIDVEGSEYEILSDRQGLKEALSKVKFIELETHAPQSDYFRDDQWAEFGYPDQHTANNILVKNLTEYGFDLTMRNNGGAMQGYNRNFKGGLKG